MGALISRGTPKCDCRLYSGVHCMCHIGGRKYRVAIVQPVVLHMHAIYDVIAVLGVVRHLTLHELPVAALPLAGELLHGVLAYELDTWQQVVKILADV